MCSCTLIISKNYYIAFFRNIYDHFIIRKCSAGNQNNTRMFITFLTWKCVIAFCWILIYFHFNLNINQFQGKMVIHLAKEPSVRLLKHVVRCYLRLSDNQRFVFNAIKLLFVVLSSWHFDEFHCVSFSLVYFRACEALQQCLPDQLRDATFAACLLEDKPTKHWLTLLIKNVDTYSINPRQVGISPLTS